MIWIESSEQARIDGILKASGGFPIGYSGGGSGGGILIVASRLTGADTAVLSADGSNPSGTYGGPGGGGRIVVATGLTTTERGRLLSGVPSRHFAATHPVFQGATSVAPASVGPDYTDEEWRTPQPGSVLFITSAGGTILLVR